LAEIKDWAAVVASSLDWQQAHVSFDNALKGLKPAQRGKRAKGFHHSVWQLVEHIRLAQADLLDFCTNPKYEHSLKWPDDYWPTKPAPASARAWTKCLSDYHRDLKTLAGFTVDHADTLTEKIPWGTGQTYLRTVLVAMDHASYHVGQIVAVRRATGAWSGK